MFCLSSDRSMDRIIDPEDKKGGLYLGSINSAQNISGLKKLNIKAVLSVANFPYLKYDPSEISHKIIPAEDVEDFDLSVYFDEAAEFIEKNLKETNVLVHCLAGISRSSSIVIAYLMKANKWKFLRALGCVRERRSIVYPNKGFEEQLRELEKKMKL